MSTPKQNLLALCDALSAHDQVTQFAISQRLLGRGDFFKNLRKPEKDLRFKTYDRLLQAFSDCWPADLEWPEAIPRPGPPAKPEDAA